MIKSSIPSLHTTRLILRQWQADDYPLFAELNASEEIMRYFPSTLSRDDSDAFAASLAAHIAEFGWGLWAVELKSTGRFMGFTGLHKVPNTLPYSPAVEIGWRFSDEYWHRGYASEAASRVLAYAFEELQLNEVVSFTSTVNKPSIKVMQRIGMSDSGLNFQHPKVPASSSLCEHVLYKIKRADFERNK